MIARRSLAGKALATCSTTFLRHCLQLVPAAMAAAPLAEAVLAAAVRLADEDEAAEAVALAGAAHIPARRYMVLIAALPDDLLICVGGLRGGGWVKEEIRGNQKIER